MSILIKGMDMPECCTDCPICDNDLQCLVLGKGVIFKNCNDERHFDCPLVEFPTPHGRLIDADKLYEKFINEYCNKNCDDSVHGKICDHCGVPRAISLIKNAPTIIEAEVSE